MKKICFKLHRYTHHFTYLSDNQGQTGRHKCAGCAFDLGVKHATMGIPKAKDDLVLAPLHQSQAGTVRHKDAFEAYNNGYNYAVSVAMKQVS